MKRLKILTSLSLWLTLGVVRADPAIMPELYGLSEPDARSALATSGFAGKIHFQETDGKDCDTDGVASGTVCGQSPLPGDRQDTALDVWVFIRSAKSAKIISSFPPLHGNDEAQAREKLMRAGFTGKIEAKIVPAEECQRDGIELGMVCGSIPEPMQRNLDSEIGITLLLTGDYSTDSKYGYIPNIIGVPLEEAIILLQNQNFSHFGLVSEPSADCTPGTICSLPTSNRLVLRKLQVPLHVATRYPDVAVPFRYPDLSGDTLLDAFNKLDSQGYRGTLINKQEEDSSPYPCRIGTDYLNPGTICNQRPIPGTKADANPRDLVVVIIKQRAPSPKMVMMPDVIGMSVDLARGVLARVGIEQVSVEESILPGCHVGIVCKSRPPALTNAQISEPKVLIIGADAPVTSDHPSDHGDSAPADGADPSARPAPAGPIAPSGTYNESPTAIPPEEEAPGS